MTQLAITNLGTIVTGDYTMPITEGNTILIEKGHIKDVGIDLDTSGYETVIDANRMTAIPGLWDTHVHTVLGDYTPRQQTVNFLDSMVHGGVTSVISAGEVHVPGRVRDPVAAKAMAILAHKTFKNLKPTGLKVHGGAFILEEGTTEEDFDELAAAGVWLIGEAGLGSASLPDGVAPMIKWGKERGMIAKCHTGGQSIPGSSFVTADVVLATGAQVAAHINGGPTSLPMEHIETLINASDIILELVQCGNAKTLHAAVDLILAGPVELQSRVIIGTDMPSGSGVYPLGILKTIANIAALNSVDPALVIAWATGNSARVYRQNTGMIKTGCEADIVIMDTPIGSVGSDALGAFSAGDHPGIAAVIIDGVLRVTKSRNTPPATRLDGMKQIDN
jgi:enamidase